MIRFDNRIPLIGIMQGRAALSRVASKGVYAGGASIADGGGWRNTGAFRVEIAKKRRHLRRRRVRLWGAIAPVCNVSKAPRLARAVPIGPKLPFRTQNFLARETDVAQKAVVVARQEAMKCARERGPLPAGRRTVGGRAGQWLDVECRSGHGVHAVI